MRGEDDPVERMRRLVGRVRRAPGAAERRHAEMVRRDDVEHHLLWSLLERVERLAGDVARMQGQLGELGRRREADAAATAVGLDGVANALDDVRTDVATLAWQHTDSDPVDLVEGPLVSVVMPTWQRARWIAAAVESVRAQGYRSWELLIVDDGSDDGTAEVVAPLLVDGRIRYLRVAHGGASAARNHALGEAGGEIVAYLDTDNTWHPTHLARHVQALLDHPDHDWSVSGQILTDGGAGRAQLQKDLRSAASLRDSNFVDINVVTHRRAALDRVGPFDPDLARLGDWDLVLRLLSQGDPVRVPRATVLYRLDSPDRITDTVPLQELRHRVRSRHRGRPAEGLRILLAEWHFPQLTESYIAALAQGLTSIGAHVEVWAEVEPSVDAGTDLQVHRGSLGDALAAARPDLVLTHWLHQGVAFRPTTRALGLPHVVRIHGFEHDPELVRGLLDDEGVFVHTFPHLVEEAWLGHPRLSAEVTCFDDVRYHPSTEKDRRLVLRTMAGLHTKDVEAFLLAASLCPDHDFVLVLGRALHKEAVTDELIERARDLGSPCEIRVDVPYDEIAPLVGRAGIYAHTHGTDHPMGMPTSIAEAMATGSHVLARDLPGAAGYLGGAGALYSGSTVEERAADIARHVRATSEWGDDRWELARRRAVEQAYGRHASSEVAERMLRSWQATFPQLRRR